jgi:tRNA(fMet)-specific endonuclease VapC
MSGKCLLDTNIVIALFASNAVVMDALQDTDEVFIPSVVIGELYYGAFKSQRVTENLERIEEFASSNTVLSCDSETARYYGEIKSFLRQKGRLIPENNIWIAALAYQHDLPLITRDIHFSSIEHIEIESW